jgi:hypothetical protein
MHGGGLKRMFCLPYEREDCRCLLVLLSGQPMFSRFNQGRPSHSKIKKIMVQASTFKNYVGQGCWLVPPCSSVGTSRSIGAPIILPHSVQLPS